MVALDTALLTNHRAIGNRSSGTRDTRHCSADTRCFDRNLPDISRFHLQINSKECTEKKCSRTNFDQKSRYCQSENGPAPIYIEA